MPTQQRSRRIDGSGRTSPFIRQEAAAERWDVSVETIRRMIARGEITGYRLNNRIIRVSVEEVDACFRPIPTVKAG